MAKSVLVVDDEELIRRSLRLGLEAAGYDVSVASDAAGALALIKDEPPDCAVIDVRLGAVDGLQLMREAAAVAPRMKPIVITAHGSVDAAVEALRLGAYDFIRKPFDLEEVITAVGNALRTEALERRVAYLSAEAEARDGALVYRSEVMAEVMRQLDKIAHQPVPVVLVLGESGTGKELVARALHRRSERAAGPFVELNCSALPEHLVESELFGHERGAFSDAREQKRGLVELADGGTLFLDEIGDLAAPAQAKLLKFVETKEFRRVGGTKQLRVDCRIVAATHRELAQSEQFRRDLYFRLAGVTLRLPPLRERPGDVLELARYFLEGFAREYRKSLERFTPAAERILEAHSWPGNVRELKAVVAYAALMADGPAITPELLGQLRGHAAPQEAEPPTSRDAVKTLERVEVEYCRRVLELFGGNKQAAAQALGITRQTLSRKIGDGEG